ncbi:hypothetical protein D3C80_340140 [compost metagenome]
MAACIPFRNAIGNVYGRETSQEALFIARHRSRETVFTIPEDHSLRADQPPAGFPAGSFTLGAPGATIGEDHIVGELKNGIGACPVGIPGTGRVLFHAKDGEGFFIGDKTGCVKGMDRHVEKQDVLHLFTEAAEMRAKEKITMNGRQITNDAVFHGAS